MPSRNKDDFLREVLGLIKFPFDRSGIKAELEDHISERVSHYLELGYDDHEKAEQAAIKDMGDPRQIGIELNKEHNPLLGWLWKGTEMLVTVVIILNIVFVAPSLLLSLFGGNRIEANGPGSEIVYELAVDEMVQLDDLVIHFTRVVYDQEENLHIFYKHYDQRLWGTGWSFSGIGVISDDLGNTYWDGTSSDNNGIVARGQRTIRDFCPEARMLIITYDHYNRSYEVKIRLPAGDFDG